MAGSTLLAATAENKFKKLFAIDLDRENIEALTNRMQLLDSRFGIRNNFAGIIGDCNVEIDGILAEIRGHGKYHALALADNAGLNVLWPSIQKLLELQQCDIIINFPTSNFNRAEHYPIAKQFLGCREDEAIPSSPIDYYCDKIRNFGQKEKYVEKVAINTDIGYRYDLILVTKAGEDGSRNPAFIGYLKSLKGMIEKYSASLAEQALEIYQKKQSALYQF